MKKQLEFVQVLFDNLQKNIKTYVDFKESYDEQYEKYRNDKTLRYPIDENFMNKNHGKTVLKRKIISLRQELLNLERMLDDVRN